MIRTSKYLVGLLVILAIGGSLARFVQRKSESDRVSALKRYRDESEKDAADQAIRVSQMFNQIYQGIRTISFLPSVRIIDRHGTNIDENAHESIVQIYKNLRSNVTISEVYIVSEDIEPEQVDPVTGNLQEPIMMFDDEVAENSGEKAAAKGHEEKKEPITTVAQAKKVEEVEIYEYLALKEQMKFFRSRYSIQDAKDPMNVPMLGSSSVLTCDNGEFEKSKKDSDRSGMMLSVPFYGGDGKLRGSITAVLRDNIIRDYLPSSGHALVNSEYGYTVLPKTPGQAEISKEWVERKAPDPTLLFSATHEVPTHDPRAKWVLWTGNTVASFEAGGDANAVTTFRRLGLIVVVALTIAALVIQFVLFRSFRNMERNNLALESKVAERAGEIERLERLQQEQKANADRERRQMLRDMADRFEAGVKDVISKVVSVSSQIQSGSESVASISKDTLERSVVVVNSSESSAQMSAQVSTAAEELTSSISEISGQTQRSSRVASSAADQAAKAQASMQRLTSQSEKVGEVVDVIEKILRQINLLALNATIEAARAGESGRGFAVVASEVKQLANQVAAATKDISVRIRDMQDATRSTATGVVQIREIIGQVSESIQMVAAAVEQQSAVTNEIARNVSQAASDAGEISKNIGTVQEGARETDKTSREVLESATILGAQSAELQKRMEEFLQTVRS